MPLTQENPSYFDDRIKCFELKHETASMKTPDSKKFEVISRDPVKEGEMEMFLSSCESNNSIDTESHISNVNMNCRISSLKRSPQEIKKMNTVSSNNNTCGRKPGSLSQKIGQFLWKSKSKNSVGSESLSLNSPAFSPDSSLSIYTNSLDGSDSQSSSTNSNQVSPKNAVNNKTLAEEHFSSYSYDDCDRYAANMYYNMGDITSFTYHLRPRNNSIPLSAKTMKRRALNDSVEPYYNNTTFSTFPNPRRHSIAYSSASTVASTTNKSTTVGENLPKCGPDGYLLPVDSQNIRNKKNLYVNESQIEVHVDVHTPTSSNSAEFPNPRSNDSTGTLVAGETYSLHLDKFCQNAHFRKNNDEKNNPMADTFEAEQQKKHGKISQDKVLPLYMSRVLLASTDCEPFCSLCSSSIFASTWKRSIMDVAIISCQECFFSRNAEAHVKGFFERMVSPENKKMEITVQSYDLKDMDHQTVATEVHRAKVQIVIVSHHFLDRLKHEATTRKKLSPINRVLRSKRVISILLGMSSEEIIEGYQAVLARFHEWFSVELRSTSKLDPEFCRKFTEQVVRIYNVELTNASNFTVFPKKITRDQQKVAILLKKPLETKDQLRIELSRGRDVEILSEVFNCNPYTALIRIPDSLCVERTALIEITAYVNQHKVGTKLIKYEFSTKSNDDDPIERMTHSVPGFLKFFDDNVAQVLSTNLRAGTSYLTDPSLELMNDVLLCRSDEFPGVMHFAAYYGLENTMWAMLELGDGFTQSNLRNANGKTPLDIAKDRKHLKLLQTIRDYQEVTNTYEAIQIMKDLYNKRRDTVIIIEKPKAEENATVNGEESVGIVSSDRSTDDEVPTEEKSSEENQDEHVPEQNMTNEEKPDITVAPKPTSRQTVKKKMEYINLKTEELAQLAKMNQEADKPPEEKKRNTRLPEKPPRVEIPKTPPISPIPNYDTPRYTAEDYQIPPPPRPVQRSPVLVKKVEGPIHSASGYIIMESPEENASKFANVEERRLPTTPEEEISDPMYPSPILRNPLKDPDIRVTPRPVMNISGHPPPKSASPAPVFDPAEEALIDLMTDFKNKVYNIREMELLFENWKDRSDVKRSIEEKTRDLKKMREDYNKIQEAVRNRKVSTFDKIRKILPGVGKKKLSNASFTDNSSLRGSSSHLNGEDLLQNQYPHYPVHTASITPLNSGDSMKPLGVPDRLSLESGGSTAGPDSGLSDPDSDKDKERENKDSTNNITDVWADVLTKRFIASYIGPNPLKFDDNGEPIDPNGPEYENSVEEDDGMYKFPPIPRPVHPKPVPKPYPPMEPLPEKPVSDAAPPPPPKKKFSFRPSRTSKDEAVSPPPPPPRNYKTPNVFTYIEYRNKNGGETPELPKKPSSLSNGTPKSPLIDRPRPYVNTTEKRDPKI